MLSPSSDLKPITPKVAQGIWFKGISITRIPRLLHKTSQYPSSSFFQGAVQNLQDDNKANGVTLCLYEILNHSVRCTSKHGPVTRDVRQTTERKWSVTRGQRTHKSELQPTISNPRPRPLRPLYFSTHSPPEQNPKKFKL